MAWIGPVVGGVVSLLGGLATNSSSRSIADQNNLTSIELANTAHQREVADLQAAGLNPILSATRPGAVTPSLQMPNLTNPWHGAVATALDIAKGLQGVEYEKAKTETEKQWTRIRKPLERGAGHADEGIKAIESAASAAANAVGNFVADFTLGGGRKRVESGLNAMSDVAREAVTKGTEAISNFSAGAAERVQEMAKDFGDRASEAIRLPGKVLGGQLNSAKDYYDSATAAMKRPPVLDKTVGRNQFKFDENAFTGDRRVDLANIAKISDPVARNAVRMGYRLWLDNFPNKRR